jgi:hypothetical protein
MTKSEKKEIEACRYLIKRFKIGYGGCKEMFTDSVKELRSGGACASCQAVIAMEILQNHIDLLKI